MKITHRSARPTLIGLALAAFGFHAAATNGYFACGNGPKAKGIGGADTPAGMVWASDRLDLGLDWVHPARWAERSTAGLTMLNGTVSSGPRNLFILEHGDNRMVGNGLSLGVAVCGNGRLNTDRPQGNFNCGGEPGQRCMRSGAVGAVGAVGTVGAADSERAAMRQRAVSVAWAQKFLKALLSRARSCCHIQG